MGLYFKGKLDGKRARTYEGKTSTYLQFVEQLEDGELKFTELKVPENVNPTQFEIGKLVEVPVVAVAMDGNIYLRVAEKPLGMSGRPEQG